MSRFLRMGRRREEEERDLINDLKGRCNTVAHPGIEFCSFHQRRRRREV